MRAKKTSYSVMLILCFAIAALWVFIYTENRKIQESFGFLEHEWTFAVNEEAPLAQPEDVLASYIFPKVVKGDVVTLTRQFTETDEKSHVISFDTWHSLTKVFVDEQQIYTWGEEYYKKGKMLGAARHCMALPRDYAGKELRIELLATEDNPMPYLTSVAYYEGYNQAAVWFNRPVGLLLIGGFFLFLSIFIIFTACAFAAHRHTFFQPMTLGISILLAGIYILSRGNFLQMIFTNPQVYNTIEYVSLFSITIPMLLYWIHDAGMCKHRGVKRLYFITLTLSILFVIVALIANFTTSVHLCQVLSIFYVVALLVAISIFLLIGFREKTDDMGRRKIYIAGICSFLIGAILSIVGFALCYNVQIAKLLKLWKWYNFILPTSMCVLVLSFSIAFYLDMKLILSNSYRSELLEYIAYYDALTKLSNRRQFNDDMAELETAKEENLYGIISIDLNGLKQINDSFGHAVGDQMLVSFAGILSDVCEDNMKSYRLSGDEFAVIIKKQSGGLFEEVIPKLYQALDTFNKDSHEFYLSAACGLATSQDADSPKSVLDLADQRMYQKKKQMKESKQDRR